MIATILDDIITRLRTDSNGSVDDSMISTFKPLLSSSLQKLDLVSRDEFDAQTAVLQRTREKLQTLEQQFVALEQQLLETHEKK